MKEKSSSKKAELTKTKIKDAFFNLYSEKPIDKISIKEITDLAGLNRGTYYVYFQDIYDLLEKVEDELYIEVSSRIKLILPEIFRGSFKVTHLNAIDLSFVKEHMLSLKLMLRQGSSSRLALRIKDLIKTELKKLIAPPNEGAINITDYVLEYIVSGQLGLITFWIEQDFLMPEKDFISMMLGINRDGPLNQIKKALPPFDQA